MTTGVQTFANVISIFQRLFNENCCIQIKVSSKFVPINDDLLILCVRTIVIHYDVIKWKHFPRYWPFVRGIHRSLVNSPHKGQWRRALMFSLICVWINGWVNNHEAGDLRRRRTQYDVIVMFPRCMGYLSYIANTMTVDGRKDISSHGTCTDLFLSKYSIPSTVTQRTHGVMITALLSQNVTKSLWRNNDVIITPCVLWVGLFLDSQCESKCAL